MSKSRKHDHRSGIIAPTLGDDGYLRVTLVKDGKAQSVAVHEIAAAAFLGPCPAGHQVRHKNGVITDNRVENLEYVPISK